MTISATAETVRQHIADHDLFAQHLGIVIEDLRDGYAKATMPLDNRHKNGVGIAHGGALFAVADLALAAASNAAGRLNLTVNSTLSFLAAGKEAPITAEAQRVGGSSRLSTYSITVRDGSGTLVASGQATTYAKDKTLADLAPR